jgi:hypothetical protein
MIIGTLLCSKYDYRHVKFFATGLVRFKRALERPRLMDSLRIYTNTVVVLGRDKSFAIVSYPSGGLIPTRRRVVSQFVMSYPRGPSLIGYPSYRIGICAIVKQRTTRMMIESS